MSRLVAGYLLAAVLVCVVASCAGPGERPRSKESAPQESGVAERAAETGPGTAVAVIASGTARAEEYQDIAALVDALLCQEPGLVPVERSRLGEILREQELSLHGLTDAAEAARIGSLMRADLLVCLRPDGGDLQVSVVDVNGARVLVEERVRRRVDVFLSAREIAELVLAASGRGRALEGRLTVGIGPIVNESATGRLDKVGNELATLLRERLRHTNWAIVLERQYPAPLLAELGLVRAGLAEAGSETVPLADIVLVGTYRETARTFAPGANVPFRARLTVASGRAGRESIEFELDGTSGRLKSFAREVLARVETERARLAPGEAEAPSPSQEIARLKKLALYLMSGMEVYASAAGRTYGVHLYRSDRVRDDGRLAARAWENVLLLGGDDREAKMFLGICLLNEFSRWGVAGTGRCETPEPGSYADRQVARGCRLIESGFLAGPSRRHGYIYRCAASFVNKRGDNRMLRYVAEHPEVFGEAESMGTDMADASSSERRFLGRYREALAVFDEKPHEALSLLSNAPGVFRGSPDSFIRFLRGQTSHAHVGVRYFTEALLAHNLFHARDPSCVEHYAKAYALYSRAMRSYGSMKFPGMWHGEANKIHHQARGVCEFYGKMDRCRDMFEMVVSEYLDSGEKLHDVSDCIALLASFYARDGSFEKGYKLCEKVIREYPLDAGLYERWRVYELHDVFAAQREGSELPGFERLERIDGPAGPHGNVRMTLAGGRLWAVLASSEQHGAAYSCEFGRARLKRVASVDSRKVTSVAAAGGRVCFGTWDKDLYVLDLRGKPVTNLRASRGELPYDGIINMCSDGEVVYASLGNHLRTGVVRLDLVKLEVQVLAPSRRDAGGREEPVSGARSLWWEPETKTLWVGNFYERRTCQLTWSSMIFAYRDGRWSRVGCFVEPHSFAVCDGRTLSITAKVHPKKKGVRTVTMTLYPGETVLQSDDPLLAFVRTAAWDEKRLWLPTVAGLYEVDRATGRMRCIAHKDKTPVFALLKDGGWLYIGARDGIYRYRIP